MKPRIRKTICILLIISFFFNSTGLAQVLPSPNLIPAANPALLRYVSVNSANPFNYFNFLLDNAGRESVVVSLDDEARELINYFFLGITLPSESFWVNLRPDEPGRITSEGLAQTDLGRILLEQDLQLKRDASKYLHPANSVGRKFWGALYKKLGKDKVEKAQIDTSNRVWIVPERAVVAETEDGALVAEAKLKVLLENEYLKQNPQDANQSLSESLMKEIILPALTEDVNTSPIYAPLRQIFHSLILAEWYKQRHKNANSPYSFSIDKGNLKGLESQAPWSRQAIWQEYLSSYQNGEYKIQDTIFELKRMYWSGGIGFFGPGGGNPIQIIPLEALSFDMLEQLNSSNKLILNENSAVLDEGLPDYHFSHVPILEKSAINDALKKAEALIKSSDFDEVEKILIELRDDLLAVQKFPQDNKDLLTDKWKVREDFNIPEALSAIELLLEMNYNAKMSQAGTGVISAIHKFSKDSLPQLATLVAFFAGFGGVLTTPLGAQATTPADSTFLQTPIPAPIDLDTNKAISALQDSLSFDIPIDITPEELAKMDISLLREYVMQDSADWFVVKKICQVLSDNVSEGDSNSLNILVDLASSNLSNAAKAHLTLLQMVVYFQADEESSGVFNSNEFNALAREFKEQFSQKNDANAYHALEYLALNGNAVARAYIFDLAFTDGNEGAIDFVFGDLAFKACEETVDALISTLETRAREDLLNKIKSDAFDYLVWLTYAQHTKASLALKRLTSEGLLPSLEKDTAVTQAPGDLAINRLKSILNAYGIEVTEVDNPSDWKRICQDNGFPENAGGFFGGSRLTGYKMKVYIITYLSGSFYKEAVLHESVHFLHRVLYGKDNLVRDFEVLKAYINENGTSELKESFNALEDIFKKYARTKFDFFNSLMSGAQDENEPDKIATEFFATYYGLLNSAGLDKAQIPDSTDDSFYDEIQPNFFEFHTSLDSVTKRLLSRHYKALGLFIADSISVGEGEIANGSLKEKIEAITTIEELKEFIPEVSPEQAVVGKVDEAIGQLLERIKQYLARSDIETVEEINGLILNEVKELIPAEERKLLEDAKQKILQKNLYFFSAIVNASEDYLLGFGKFGKIGVSVELAKSLPTEELSEYILHEALELVTPQGIHTELYTGIQRQLFGKNNLKESLRNYIDQFAASNQGDTQDLATSEKQDIILNLANSTLSDSEFSLRLRKALDEKEITDNQGVAYTIWIEAPEVGDVTFFKIGLLKKGDNPKNRIGPVMQFKVINNTIQRLGIDIDRGIESVAPSTGLHGKGLGSALLKAFYEEIPAGTEFLVVITNKVDLEKIFNEYRVISESGVDKVISRNSADVLVNKPKGETKEGELSLEEFLRKHFDFLLPQEISFDSFRIYSVYGSGMNALIGLLEEASTKGQSAIEPFNLIFRKSGAPGSKIRKILGDDDAFHSDEPGTGSGVNEEAKRLAREISDKDIKSVSSAVSVGNPTGSGAIDEGLSTLENEWDYFITTSHKNRGGGLHEVGNTFNTIAANEVLKPMIQKDVEKAEKTNKQLVYIVSAGRLRDIHWLLETLKELIPENNGWKIGIIIINVWGDSIESAKGILNGTNLPVKTCYLKMDMEDKDQIDHLSILLSKLKLLEMADGVMHNLGQAQLGENEINYLQVVQKLLKNEAWFQIDKDFTDNYPEPKNRQRMEEISNLGFVLKNEAVEKPEEGRRSIIVFSKTASSSATVSLTADESQKRLIVLTQEMRGLKGQEYTDEVAREIDERADEILSIVFKKNPPISESLYREQLLVMIEALDYLTAQETSSDDNLNAVSSCAHGIGGLIEYVIVEEDVVKSAAAALNKSFDHLTAAGQKYSKEMMVPLSHYIHSSDKLIQHPNMPEETKREIMVRINAMAERIINLLKKNISQNDLLDLAAYCASFYGHTAQNEQSAYLITEKETDLIRDMLILTTKNKEIYSYRIAQSINNFARAMRDIAKNPATSAAINKEEVKAITDALRYFIAQRAYDDNIGYAVSFCAEALAEIAKNSQISHLIREDEVKVIIDTLTYFNNFNFRSSGAIVAIEGCFEFIDCVYNNPGLKSLITENGTTISGSLGYLSGNIKADQELFDTLSKVAKKVIEIFAGFIEKNSQLTPDVVSRLDDTQESAASLKEKERTVPGSELKKVFDGTMRQDAEGEHSGVSEEAKRLARDIQRDLAQRSNPAQDYLGDIEEKPVELRWWMRDYWQNKGEPIEQISLTVNSQPIDIYSWDSKLTDEQITEIIDTLRKFVIIADGKALQIYRHILIDNKSRINPLSGEEMNGYSDIWSRAIILYPPSVKPIEYRIKGISNLKGTLVHELAHSLTALIFGSWVDTFGWQELDVARELPGGEKSRFRLIEPERAPSEYATAHPNEDICDSMVAALENRGALDLERFKFLDDRFTFQNFEFASQISLDLQEKIGNDISLPEDVKFVKKTQGQGGIDLSNIELTLKDESYTSNLNPADIKVLRAAKALKNGWESLSLLYIHEIRLMLKDHIINDIQNKDLLLRIMNQLQMKTILDPQATQFFQFIQTTEPSDQIKVAAISS